MQRKKSMARSNQNVFSQYVEEVKQNNITEVLDPIYTPNQKFSSNDEKPKQELEKSSLSFFSLGSINKPAPALRFNYA